MYVHSCSRGSSSSSSSTFSCSLSGTFISGPKQDPLPGRLLPHPLFLPTGAWLGGRSSPHVIFSLGEFLFASSFPSAVLGRISSLYLDEGGGGGRRVSISISVGRAPLPFSLSWFAEARRRRRRRRRRPALQSLVPVSWEGRARRWEEGRRRNSFLRHRDREREGRIKRGEGNSNEIRGGRAKKERRNFSVPLAAADLQTPPPLLLRSGKGRGRRFPEQRPPCCEGRGGGGKMEFAGKERGAIRSHFKSFRRISGRRGNFANFLFLPPPQ